ncbi:hypothetical protein PHJA_002679500 [Phtheirospermum japonicum]|uniref:Uncharacterized protein n=1 Tax=Phtheirospermum japonicum TaxID=374723 RepID=A0A830DB55_9LAMI|nr:hypothetical protein PHJA_002679500 [Phtheirospermum japonicum]
MGGNAIGHARKMSLRAKSLPLGKKVKTAMLPTRKACELSNLFQVGCWPFLKKLWV